MSAYTIIQRLGMVSRPPWTSWLNSAVWLLAHYLFSTNLPLSFFSHFTFFFSPSLTGCHHIFSQLPTTSYSATTDLNTDLALSVPLRREQEIPYPRLPRTKLQGWILPVSSVFRLLEYMPCYFFQIPTHFTFQLITAQTGKHCSWLKEMASLGV